MRREKVHAGAPGYLDHILSVCANRFAVVKGGKNDHTAGLAEILGMLRKNHDRNYIGVYDIGDGGSRG